MDETLKTGGGDPSGLATTALPGRKLAISKTPRMLTPSEIAILREDLKAAVAYLRATAEPLIESEPARHSDHRKAVPTPKSGS